jgi:hypothetical protein
MNDFLKQFGLPGLGVAFFAGLLAAVMPLPLGAEDSSNME